MLRKSKLSSAVVVALATAFGGATLTGLTGCNLTEGDVSLTSGTSSTITNPKGTVTGNVQDTNGNPVDGAKVYLAGKSVKTDLGGNYRFNNVPVTNTTGTGDDTQNGTLVVTIVPEAGFLGAAVTVTPEAQLNNNGDNGGGAINPVTTFIDGYIASAGTTVIPALTSTVTGVLRDSVTGEAIANTLVSLDLEGVGATMTGQQATQNATATSYQTFAYTATTGADGSFTISNVPSDSQLIFEIEGHAAVSIAYNDDGTITHVDTSDENITTNVGNLLATPYVNIDDVAPYVVRVEGVQDQAAGTGQLNNDIDGTTGIVVHFSEAVDAAQIDANSIIVYDTTNEAYVDVASATMTTARTLTITTTGAIPAGANFDINFLRADFMDLEGNNIAAVATTDDVGFDSVITSSANATDIYRLDMRTFKELSMNAVAVTLGQLDTDATGLDDDESVQATNAAFADVDDGTAGFQQLNSADDDDTLNGSDAGERLSALASAVSNTGPITVEADVARVDFTPENAVSYTITIVDKDGAANNVATITLDSNPDDVGYTDVGGNVHSIHTLDGSVAPIEMVIAGVAPGDVVTITPMDDLGYAGAAYALTMVDNVSPTAVLQNSYGANPDTTSEIVNATFGSGGELSNIGSDIVGLPILNVTAQLLDNLVDDGTGNAESINVGGVSDDDLVFELMAYNTVDINTGLPYINPLTGIYDATAFTNLNAQRTMGFSMSEDVALTGTAPAFTGTAAVLSNYVVKNDVTANDNGGPVNVDLVLADVDSVFQLAADNNAVVDFAGAIEDVAGNVAVDASVVIRDAMPPMVVSAVYNGTDMVVTFNEAVDIDFTNDVVFLSGAPIGLTNASLSAGNTVLTILPEVPPAIPADPVPTGVWVDGDADGYADLPRATVFALGEYPEPPTAVTYTVQGVNLAENHGELSTVFIADVNGNTWATDSAGVTTPSIAMIDATGAFEVLTATTAAATPATVNYVFTHPLNVVSTFGACGGVVTDTTLDSIAVGACFTNTGAGTFTDATYNAATNTLSVNLSTLAAADVIAWTANGGNAVGEYDLADATVVADVVVP